MRSRLQKVETELERIVFESDRAHLEEMERVHPPPERIHVPGPERIRVPRKVVVTQHGKCFHHANCRKIADSTGKTTYGDCFFCRDQLRDTGF